MTLRKLYSIIGITLTVIVYLNVVAAKRNREDSFMENDFYYDQDDDRHTNIISRKRRYLTFPQGSSFQLVYDLIIGVVDFTNYLILGVTSALAWQLPSEPPSEIVDNLREKLHDGTFGTSRNDTIENIQYVDTNGKQEYQSKPTYVTSSTNTSYVNPQPSHYYIRNQFHPPLSTKYYSSHPDYYSSPSRKQDLHYYSTNRNPLTEWKQTQNISPGALKYAAVASKLSNWWNKNNRKTAEYSKNPYYRKKHKIYPVFAKRSVHNRQKRHGISGPSLTKIDKIHLRYHRSTRHELFPKIEKYLESHKKNGKECVLKALCETGQKQNEVEPGSFVGEIMRAIFTLPESDDPVYDSRHKIYDEAHAHQGNCTEKYPLCQDSVWTADFIF